MPTDPTITIGHLNTRIDRPFLQTVRLEFSKSALEVAPQLDAGAEESCSMLLQRYLLLRRKVPFVNDTKLVHDVSNTLHIRSLAPCKDVFGVLARAFSQGVSA